VYDPSVEIFLVTDETGATIGLIVMLSYADAIETNTISTDR
jgi:hypothetical protein